MKADLVGISNVETIVGPTHGPKPVKRVNTPSVSQSATNKPTADLSAGIERADRIAAKVSQKLQDMSKFLNQIGNETNDIIRERLARFFNVLKVYIEEALHPTGDWSSDQIISGKTLKVNIGADGASIVVQGERITMDNLEIRELSKSPTNDDIETMQQNIRKAQASVKKLRTNLASVRLQIAHQSKESTGLTL
jgi:hypothetical protein